MKRYQKYLSLLLVLVAFNSNALQCGAGKVEVDGVCVSSCKILEGTGKNLTWDAYIWGDNPRSYCIGDRSTGAACRMTAGSVSISVEGNKWTNKFTYTGSTCAFDEINRFSGDTPEPFPYENDVNQNGVDDKYEDWDGDGIDNHEDPDPYKNNNELVDNNDNGVPDSIDDFYDRLNDIPAVGNCSTDDPDCWSYRSVAAEQSRNIGTLARGISDLSLRSVRRTDFNQSIGALTSNISVTNDYFKQKLDSLAQASGNTASSINSQIFATEAFLRDRIHDNASVSNNKIDDVQRSVNWARNDIDDVRDNVTNFATQFDEVDTNILDTQRQIQTLTNLLLDGSGSGLTSTQKNQLKNAAKANANQKLLKTLSSDINSNQQSLTSQMNNLDGGLQFVSEGFGVLYSDVTDSLAALDPKFNQLSEQIAAISGGTSTVDLSSVESSIDALSDKIDGLDGSDMSGVESKLTDLIDGITNNNNFVEPSSGFDGEGFIVNQNQIAEVQNEVLEIKQEMSDEFEKFKALFSIDTSSFNNGTYKEHSLNLNVNHAERSFKSGVLSALLDNATLISAVVMFLFVLSGIRMLGKD